MNTATVTPEVSVDTMDEFGRTEAERTIVLESLIAERVNNEVTDGNHDTYVDALNYVIERGFAEIARARESQQKAKLQRQAAVAMSKLTDLLAKQPTIIANPAAMTAALKATGIYTPAVVTLLHNMGCKLQ